MQHNDGYLERIAQDLIRLQFWLQGFQAAGGKMYRGVDTAMLSLHQAVMVIRECKTDEHGAKGVDKALYEVSDQDSGACDDQ
jgi:hypothetical protein